MLIRSLVVWLILIAAETVHGVVRALILEPTIGDFPARQVGVATGSVLILIATYFLIDWIGARSKSELAWIGALWVALTFSFEIGIGRYVAGYSWERIFSDFNLAAGGFLGVGLLILGFAPRMAYSFRRVKASAIEQLRRLPGDEVIPEPIGSLTHAITIGCSRKNLWPWLTQMGAGRAGWYSYDFLDNGWKRSARRILPALQEISAGRVFPALPGATDGFILLAYEPERFLVLAFPSHETYAVTWAFFLESIGASTRLIVRARANAGYRSRALPLWLIRPIHFIMQRKQLLGIARRAEAASSSTEMAAQPARG